MPSVKYEKKGKTALLTISRPAEMNSLNNQVLAELEKLIPQIQNDSETAVLVITGDGDKAFVAGADIAEMSNMSEKEGAAFAARGQAVFESIERLPIPVIAAVNGFALGGGTELALACDMIIASEKAFFGQPEVKLGITPGFGGTQRLTRAVGRAKAAELIFTGRRLPAQDALSLGMINEVVPHDRVMEKALELAAAVTANSAYAVNASKACIKAFYGTSFKGYETEAALFGKCFGDGEQKEGMKAFLEKRKPDFK
jgi:enoyl-CoA hydratase